MLAEGETEQLDYPFGLAVNPGCVGTAADVPEPSVWFPFASPLASLAALSFTKWGT